jgi:hypothetical protein
MAIGGRSAAGESCTTSLSCDRLNRHICIKEKNAIRLLPRVLRFDAHQMITVLPSRTVERGLNIYAQSPLQWTSAHG